MMPSVRTDTDYFPFRGGTDLTTPALSVPPGSVLESSNYEPSIDGGYSRIKGYEAFDGRASPSAATYTDLACTLTSTPAVGELVTIGAATGLFVKAVTGGCILTGVTGTIPASTTMTIAGPTNIGTTAASTSLTTPITPAVEAQNLVDAAEVYRALIVKPSGSGPIRGVVQYNGSVYCFRDNVGGTAGQLFKATASGWALQSLGEEVSFTNANLSVGDGDTLTQGGVTATIQRVVVQTGTLASGTNTGRLIITGRSGGNLAAGAATSTGGGSLTISGAQSAITLPAGGVYSFDVYNFGGQLTTRRLYGANGVGRAFEYDGTVFVPLVTGASTDTPKFVRANRKYLYWAVGSSVIGSSVGNPYRVVASEGSAEFAVGDDVTGLVVMTGESLGIMCRNSSNVLYGSSSADWTIKPLRDDVGGVAYTVQSMSNTLMLDDRGVTSFEAAQTYGNFADSTLSRKVQPLVDQARGIVVTSYISRARGLYVLLMSDGSTLTMGLSNNKVSGFMPGKIDFTPSCAHSSEDSNGVERIFVGGADGHVYEFNKGSTFNGAEIESYLRVYYYNSKSPRVRKTYRRMALEMSCVLYTSLMFRGELTYGDPRVQQMLQREIEASGTGGVWDSVTWDQFFWDSQSVNQPSVRLEGTGLNLALGFYSSTKLDFGHTLQGAIIHYTARRNERG